MPRCAAWVSLLLLLACRAERPRATAHAARDSVRAAPAWDATTDGCRQIGGQRPDITLDIGGTAAEAWRRAVARGIEYRCEVDPSLTLRFVVAGDTTSPSLDSVVVRADSPDAPIVQVLHRDTDAEMPLPYHTDVLRLIDLDADGHRDVLVGRFWGATGNRGYEIWRFDPAVHRFTADSAMSDMWNPAPIPGRSCISTSSNSSARDYGIGVYCLHAGRWTLDSVEQNTWQRESHTVRREIHSRRGDSLVILKTETRADSM
jgi:hypothetical protein